MASQKNCTKSKIKDDKAKYNKCISQSTDGDLGLDLSMIRKPILTSVTSFNHVRKIFDNGTEELKHLLAEECDLLYECKVCRNISRSLVNYISHKRIFCKEKFKVTIHGHFIQPTSIVNEMQTIKIVEDGYQESLKSKESYNHDDYDNRVPITKDLTKIFEVLNKNNGVPNHEINNKVEQMTFQNIPTSSKAVFQNISAGTPNDNMLNQIKELNAIESQNRAVLQKDGTFTIQNSENTDKENMESKDKATDNTGDNVIQISDDDEDSHSLKCKICNLQFSTQKTLKFHMKHKHLESRLVYPCPDCVDIFSTSWSVYRHLFKVHRKTIAQIRRLRESIQSKAFKMNNPPAFYEKRKNNLKAANTMQRMLDGNKYSEESQEWIENIEADSEMRRCGGCGRLFERRAALAAHIHTCQPRNKALSRRTTDKKIEIQIRKDYNKSPQSSRTNTSCTEPKTIDVTDKAANVERVTEKVINPPVNDEITTEINSDYINKDRSDIKEIIGDEQSDNNEAGEEEISLPFYANIERRNMEAFKKKLEQDVDVLVCKKCSITCIDYNSLELHMASHYKWYRYGCKLCNFKHYLLNQLPIHIKIVHKLRGDNEFYLSTIKALDAKEAIDINHDVKTIGTVSRRSSLCSSDSSRHSDNESSSSNSRTDLPSKSRKRKLSAYVVKDKKEEHISKDGKVNEEVMDNVILSESESNLKDKSFDENSSGIEDNDEKSLKPNLVTNETSSNKPKPLRRPVRKRFKRKHDDFEYDLSNLLKIDAQGYRESQPSSNQRLMQCKKKNTNDLALNEVVKAYAGALILLSKKAVEKSQAHLRRPPLKQSSASAPTLRYTTVFIKPSIPKTQVYKSLSETKSPKIETVPDSNDSETQSNSVDNSNIVTNNEKKADNIKEESLIKIEEIILPDKVTELKSTSSIFVRKESLDVVDKPNISKSEFPNTNKRIILIKPLNNNKGGSALSFKEVKNTNGIVKVLKYPGTNVPKKVSENVLRYKKINKLRNLEDVPQKAQSEVNTPVITNSISCESAKE